MAGYIYNCVYLQYCQTVDFQMEQEYDPSNTDAVWNKYTIRVRGFVSEDDNALVTNTSVELNRIKNALETPRRAMSYTVGADTLVQVTTPPDDKLGPRPLPTSVRQVTSGTYLVETGCVVHQVSCDEWCTGQDFSIVSLRWGQTETFDENWNSQLITTGKLIVKSSAGFSADAARLSALPVGGPPPNYRRLSSKYTLSPDGTMLDFEFVDAEQDRMPPFPATRVQGTFTVNVKKGTLREGTVELTLDGPRGIPRASLMAVAVRMGISKLTAESPIGAIVPVFGPLPIGIFNWSMSEDLTVPQVRFSASCMLAPMGSAGAAGTGGALPAGTVPSGVAGFPSVGLIPAGLIGAGPGLAPPARKAITSLLVALFRDPCLCSADGSPAGPCPSSPGPADLGPGGGSQNGIQTVAQAAGYVPPPALIRVAPVSPWYQTPSVTDDAPYDQYEAFADTIFDSGYVHMPGTGVGNGGTVSEVVKADGGQMQLTVAWTARRTGRPPVLPAFFVDDANVVPLTGSVVANQVTPSATGASLIFEVAGFYRYAILDPALFQIIAPIPPFMSQVVADDAQLGTANWAPILRVRGSPTSNPFVAGQYTLNSNPGDPPGFDLPYDNDVLVSVGQPPQSVIQIDSQNTLSPPGSSSGGGGDFNIPIVGP